LSRGDTFTKTHMLRNTVNGLHRKLTLFTRVFLQTFSPYVLKVNIFVGLCGVQVIF